MQRRVQAGPRQRGITLIELLIALVIVGILTAVALPLYTRYQERSYAAQAMADLGVCAQALERHYTTGFTYANSTAAAVPPAAAPLATICPAASPPRGDTLFNITITAADATTFTLRATPVAAGRADPVGMLEIDASGVRRWDRNDDNDFDDADEDNWDI
ncbi:MAG: type IV pilin protein [Pseudomonadales bacterium]|jgi:type IV pilus assembly protein PilE|nr:type IV pilin protein [Pseudomonadales bacterium]